MKQPQQSSRGAGTVLRALAPPPALCGFLLLLALIFTVSYAVGATAGPVAPGMHRSGTSGGTDMGDMDMRHGSGG
ncbi:hypothetical protein IM697_17475 [Streptomyces ferrugineus]|uniref:Uncharacterized protein n=1 Tax=Streptomyces ferrugineus TaxID=1413221 RepID=A0A7M2SWJ3_9ACTN|nr:hypothetical protein [Streptomyces ferrugineus]QOV40025.1 hypothetical protein IM697_17475 [Streptomyces ferrugineus]